MNVSTDCVPQPSLDHYHMPIPLSTKFCNPCSSCSPCADLSHGTSTVRRRSPTREHMAQALLTFKFSNNEPSSRHPSFTCAYRLFRIALALQSGVVLRFSYMVLRTFQPERRASVQPPPLAPANIQHVRELTKLFVLSLVS